MKISKLILAALAITFGWVMLSTETASATTLSVTTGQEEVRSHTDFGGVTQINIERGGKLFICTGTSGYATIAANITFLSTGSGANPSIRIEPCLGADGQELKSRGGTFTGTITLHIDAAITAYSSTIRANGSVVSNDPGIKRNLAIVTESGGRLLGTGLVGTVSLASGTFIAPGNSPGILSTGDLTLVSGSTYEFELGGTIVGTQYDQINVTGTVDLGNGNLDVILYEGFKPTIGQTFTIINNDESDAITGTFTGLAEGATFTDEGVTYRISYVGGSGNDAVLTVMASSPDTGFALFKSNPLLTGGIMIVSAFAMLLIARKYVFASR